MLEEQFSENYTLNTINSDLSYNFYAPIGIDNFGVFSRPKTAEDMCLKSTETTRIAATFNCS